MDFKKGDFIMCIDVVPEDGELMDITIGKVYISNGSYYDHITKTYVVYVIDDVGDNYDYLCSNFIKIEEHRNKVIDNILE